MCVFVRIAENRTNAKSVINAISVQEKKQKVNVHMADLSQTTEDFGYEPEREYMNTGLFDKNGTPINVGDKTRLVLENGEVREFDVRFKTVQRTTIKTLRGFAPESVDVSITGIFFCWDGNDLLPCVDENGVSDVEKMEVIQPPVWGASSL